MSAVAWGGRSVSFHEIAVGGPSPNAPGAPFYRLWSARSEDGVFRFEELDQTPAPTFRVHLKDFKGSIPPENACKALIEGVFRTRLEHWNKEWQRPDFNPVTIVFSGHLTEAAHFDDGAWRAPTMELVVNA